MAEGEGDREEMLIGTTTTVFLYKGPSRRRVSNSGPTGLNTTTLIRRGTFSDPSVVGVSVRNRKDLTNYVKCFPDNHSQPDCRTSRT